MASHEDLVREIETRWQSLLEEVDKICDSIGRKRPTIVAVSKRHSVEKIVAAYDAGLRDFGENYAQEMEEKSNQINKNLKWHFIGPLQRRHAKAVSSIASMIHAV
ncbi:MAG: YggS family pyridoxal phosphate-dependent enzyme, partial [Methanobacteriota archaeon]